MSKYEDAKLRAAAATVEPVSTFSPMQVRPVSQHWTCRDMAAVGMDLGPVSSMSVV